MTARPTPLTGSITQSSWEKVLGVFDSRLVTVPLEHGIILQHWKETVVEVYLDFVEKLPDAELPALVVRAAWEDGRTENYGVRSLCSR